MPEGDAKCLGRLKYGVNKKNFLGILIVIMDRSLSRFL